MRCPECGLEAIISYSRTEVEGDKSPDTETRVFTVLEYQCRNPTCPQNGKSVGESKHQTYPEE